MTPILEFANVSRSYQRDKPVLDGVSLSVSSGEVVGLLGRNGAGKTTLIRIAMGMLFPHSGQVRVFGLSPTTDPVAVKSRIGYVAEDQVLPPGLTVAEIVGLHRYLFPRWDPSLESELLDRFRLRPGAKIKQLSKGEARQVALLCAVCHRPELLVLDEPAGGLDPATRREFLETSIQLLNREGAAILFSSHHMSDVERIGARVVLLDRAKILLDRDLDALREEVCLALVPRFAAPDAASIERLPGCLGVRLVRDDWHAVFNSRPYALSAFPNAHCISLPLEDLFIELVGADRPQEVGVL